MKLTASTLAVVLFFFSAAPAFAQNHPYTEQEVNQIEYHFKLDQYMVFGCISGAALGVVAGVLTFSGITPLAAPYIAFGCSTGFLAGAVVLMAQDLWHGRPMFGPPPVDGSGAKATPPMAQPSRDDNSRSELPSNDAARNAGPVSNRAVGGWTLARNAN
ncbi:MAG: hypothetical protein GC191_15055 [Azospirillum sp.]|nr:hypothetical protein [Azospirillum sp.]